MEHIQNTPPAAATDEPAVPPTYIRPGARRPAPVAEEAAESGVDAGWEMFAGRAVRHDGWTPERIGRFLRALAATGCVTTSVRAAGMTKQAAYTLRNSTKGRAFALAWNAALHHARDRLADELLSRAVNGNVEVVFRDGALWEERHRFDNGLGLTLLARLDRLAENNDGGNAARFVAEEFDQFVDLAAAGGEGAAGFVAARCALGYRGHEEKQVLERAENFVAAGDGLPEGYEAPDSPAADLIRSLFSASCDDDGDDEDELEPAEACEDQPEAEGQDGPEAEEDLSDMSLEEFMRDALAGPFGEIDEDDDDDEDEDDEADDDEDDEEGGEGEERAENEGGAEGGHGSGDIEADAACLATRSEAALGRDEGDDR